MAITVTELRANLKLRADKAGFDGAKKAITDLKANVKKLAVAFTGAAVGLAVLTKGVSDQIREIDIFSRRFGISTQSLQVWLSLAKKAGVESTQFADGIKDFTIKLGQAKKSTDPAAMALKKLGLNFKQLRKDSPEQRLEKVLLALNKVEDASTRAALAAQIAGDTGGQTFITLANEAKNYGAEKKALTDTGALITGEDQKAANDMAQSLHELDIAVFAVKKTIATALVPIIKVLVSNLSKWIGKNKAMLSQKVEALARGIASAFETMAPLISWAADNAQLLITAWVAFKALQIANSVWTVVASLIAFATAEEGVAAGAAVMWAAITGPVGLVIAAIIAVVAAIYLIWKNLDFVKKMLGYVWDAIKFSFDVSPLGLFINHLDDIGNFFVWIWDTLGLVKDAVVEAFDVALLGPFQDALGVITDAVGWLGDKLGLGGPSKAKQAKNLASWEGKGHFPGFGGSNTAPSNVNRNANTVSIAKPGAISVAAPEVNSHIKVYIGNKEIKDIAKQEATTIVDKKISGANI